MMDTGVQQQHTKSSLQMTNIKTEVSAARRTEHKGCTPQAEMGKVFKPQSGRELPGTTVKEPEQQGETNATSKYFGNEPVMDIFQENVYQDRTACQAGTKQEQPEQKQNINPELCSVNVSVSDSENKPLLKEEVEGSKHDRNTNTSEDKYKIFVIGKTGTGKSSLCNKIIGRDVFATDRSFSPVTTEMKEEKATVGGRKITVVDTPDVSTEDEAKQKETVKMWKESAKGYNYMIVLTVRCDTRFCPAEYHAYKQIKQLWGKDLCRRLFVAFTFGDARINKSRNMRDELEGAWPELKHVIKDADNRFVVFGNEAGNMDETSVNAEDGMDGTSKDPVQQLVDEFQKLPPTRATKISWYYILIGATGTLAVAAICYLVYWLLSNEA